jgi:hypothetical protein
MNGEGHFTGIAAAVNDAIRFYKRPDSRYFQSVTRTIAGCATKLSPDTPVVKCSIL